MGMLSSHRWCSPAEMRGGQPTLCRREKAMLLPEGSPFATLCSHSQVILAVLDFVHLYPLAVGMGVLCSTHIPQDRVQTHLRVGRRGSWN